MTEEPLAIRLRHMLDSVVSIERLTANKKLADYEEDPDLAAAVERYLERLSEASRHVPEEMKAHHPNVDWRGVADIGNALRHAYDAIVDRRIWAVISDDLAPLKSAIESMIDALVEQRDK